MTKPRPILYISGPYSPGNGRTTEENVEVARAHAAAAWRAGWAAFTPHLNTSGFEETCPDLSWRDWLDGDLAILDRLDPATDAMLMLPGWQESKGASWEYYRAAALGLEIFEPPTSPDAIVPVGVRAVCPHYRRVHCGSGDDRDTCGSIDKQCPPLKVCPMRERCR